MCYTMSSRRWIICHPAFSSAAAGRGDEVRTATTKTARCGPDGEVLLCNPAIRIQLETGLFTSPRVALKKQSPSRGIQGQPISLAR